MTDELDQLQLAIATLMESEVTVQFGPVMKMRRKDEPWQLVVGSNLVEAARLAAGPRRYVIFENLERPLHAWRYHISSSSGRARCFSPLIGEGWTYREVSEDELIDLEPFTCWGCRYIFAPAFERHRIERRQGVALGMAKPPTRLKEPQKGDWGRDEDPE